MAPAGSYHAKPTILRCNPSRTDIVVLGLDNGKLFFLKLSTQETFVFDAHQDSVVLKADDSASPTMAVVDMAWDP